MIIDIKEAVDGNAELQVLDAAFSSETVEEFSAVFDSGITANDFSDKSYGWVWVTLRQSFYDADWSRLPFSFYERLEEAVRSPRYGVWERSAMNHIAAMSLEHPPHERREVDGVYKFMVGSRHWWQSWLHQWDVRYGKYGVPVAEEVEKYRQRLHCKRKIRGLQRIATQMLKDVSDDEEAATADGVELFILGQLERFREELE
jgi:hypothetical protein